MESKSIKTDCVLPAARLKKLGTLEKKIGYRYKDICILNQALTHSSYANENPQNNYGNNEKFEFLGDSVLELIISEYLLKHYPHCLEGELTKLRAELVNASSLYLKSKYLGLGHYLLLGKGEEQSGGREKTSILSDAVEALIGSIFLDGGYKASRTFVRSLFKKDVETISMPDSISDFKTLLQEKTQKYFGIAPQYKLLSSVGPDHDRTFYISVGIRKEILGTGIGKTKKDAEQMAAREALPKIKPSKNPTG